MARVVGEFVGDTCAAISTPPFTGGLYIGNGNVAMLNERPFVIDHDQKISLQGIANYGHPKGFYATVSTRFDSGLVTGNSDPAVVAGDRDYYDLLPYVNLLSGHRGRGLGTL